MSTILVRAKSAKNGKFHAQSPVSQLRTACGHELPLEPTDREYKAAELIMASEKCRSDTCISIRLKAARI